MSLRAFCLLLLFVPTAFVACGGDTSDSGPAAADNGMGGRLPGDLSVLLKTDKGPNGADPGAADPGTGDTSAGEDPGSEPEVSDPCASCVCEGGDQCNTVESVCGAGACQCNLRPVEDGTPCVVDPEACTEGDTCQSGQCVQGGPKNCDDGEQCTADSCDPAQGCVNSPMSGTPCVFEFLFCEQPGTCGTNGCVPNSMSGCTCAQPCTICLCCPPWGSFCAM